jgi:hypothetical protein
LGPLDRHNQTPNPDAISFMAFFDTKEIGPIVFDTPPGGAEAALTDNIVTVWQTALKDVGLLGVDKGAGGKFCHDRYRGWKLCVRLSRFCRLD